MKKSSPSSTPHKKIRAKFLAYAKATKFDNSGADLGMRQRIIRKPLPQWEYDFNELPDDKQAKRTDDEKSRIERIAYHEFGREDWRNYQPDLLEAYALPFHEMDRIHGKIFTREEMILKPVNDSIEHLMGEDWCFKKLKTCLQEMQEQHSGFLGISYHAIQIDWRNNKEDIVDSFRKWMEQQPESKTTRRGKVPWAIMNAQLDWLAAWRTRRAGYTYDEFRAFSPRPREVYSDKYVFNESCKKAEKIIVAIAKGMPLRQLLGAVERG